MEAPDKIYLHPDIGGREFIRPWLHRAANSESVAYIRKDALLEWAKEKLESMRNLSPSDGARIYSNAINDLVDKLNSI